VSVFLWVRLCKCMDGGTLTCSLIYYAVYQWSSRRELSYAVEMTTVFVSDAFSLSSLSLLTPQLTRGFQQESHQGYLAESAVQSLTANLPESFMGAICHQLSTFHVPCHKAQCSVCACLYCTQRTWKTTSQNMVAWNLLPDYLWDPTRSVDSFRRDLKTFLFSLY